MLTRDRSAGNVYLMLAAWPRVVSVVVALAATTLLPPAGAEAATTSPTCTLAGDLVEQGSTRGSNLTPEGLGGSAGATPEACQAACCGHALCVAFTHSSFQETASANCAHGQPCCWLKASYAPIPGSANETAGHISRPPNVASPASVPIRVLTDVTIMLASGSPVPNLTAGERAVCTLVAAAGGWAREPETFANGLVLNTSAVRCAVNATAELGGLASLRAVSA